MLDWIYVEHRHRFWEWFFLYIIWLLITFQELRSQTILVTCTFQFDGMWINWRRVWESSPLRLLSDTWGLCYENRYSTCCTLQPLWVCFEDQRKIRLFSLVLGIIVCLLFLLHLDLLTFENWFVDMEASWATTKTAIFWSLMVSMDQKFGMGSAGWFFYRSLMWLQSEGDWN